MKFRHELSYDAPPDRVYAMLADPEFRRRSCEAMEVISADVRLEPGTEDGEGFSLVIDQLQNTRDLPSFARTFAALTTTKRQDTSKKRSGGMTRTRRSSISTTTERARLRCAGRSSGTRVAS